MISVRYVPKIFTLSGYKFTGDSGNCHRHTDIMGDRRQDFPIPVQEEQTGQVSYGAEYCEYASAKKRMEYVAQPAYYHMEIHPKTFTGIGCSRLGGYQAITAIHLGSVDNINETYKKAFHWADKHGFILMGNAVERYIVDILSIFDEKDHVTEILLPIEDDEKETVNP
jgi:effector-binding domain-containing protein